MTLVQERAVLVGCNITFIACFTLEMMVKIIALGLVWAPGAYLRDSWNRLDAFLVVVSLTGLFLEAWGVAAAGEAFIMLRILRLLRLQPCPPFPNAPHAGLRNAQVEPPCACMLMTRV